MREINGILIIMTLILTIGMLPVSSSVRAGAVWYVDDDAAGDPGPGDPAISNPREDGTALYPFDAIQEAITAAVAGEWVVVEDGTYTGEGNRDLDFKGKEITVLGRNGAQNCIIDLQDTGRGFYFHHRESSEALVMGFTLRNGWPAVDSECKGGGIYCKQGSNPTIASCIIENCRADTGSSICCVSSSPRIIHCKFTRNISQPGTSGICSSIACLQNSYPEIISCRMTDMNSYPGCTGIYSVFSRPLIADCTMKSENHDKSATTTLDNGLVSPVAGYYGTLYEFTIEYYDNSGSAPQEVYVNIDGISYDMTLSSGSASNGTYSYATQDIAMGPTHRYYFEATSALGDTSRFPAVNTLVGPTNFPPDLYVTGPPVPGATMRAVIWGPIGAFWSIAGSNEPGPLYVPAADLIFDIGPDVIYWIKEIGDLPYVLNYAGYRRVDFVIPSTVHPGTKYLQGATKAGHYWAKTNQVIIQVEQ